MVTLERLLSLPQLQSVRVLAGEEGLCRGVIWTNVLESPDTLPFVREHELVFTTGVEAGAGGSGALLRLMEGACRAGASGMVLNVGHYILEVDAVLLEFARQNGFPLLTLPWEVRIADTTHAICEYIIKNGGGQSARPEAASAAALFSDLLFHRDNLAFDVEALTQHGYGNDAVYTALACLCGEPGGMDDACADACAALGARGVRPVCVFHGEWAVLLTCRRAESEITPETPGDAAAAAFRARKLPAVVGEGRSYRYLMGARRSCDEAMLTARIRRDAAPGKAKVFRYEELGVHRLFYELRDRPELGRFREEVLSRLEEFDRVNSTGYLEFLAVWLEEGFSPARTSARLYIHRNTVLYKLNKIEEILGCSLDSPQVLLELQVAMAIRDLNLPE